MKQNGLTSITIENFKGIGAPVTVPLRPITLLFGANSAGKSTIIQALQYAWEVLENRNPDVDRTRLGGEVIDLGGFRNLVHRNKADVDVKTIDIKITLSYCGLPFVSSYLPSSEYFSKVFGNTWVNADTINVTSYLDFKEFAVSVTTSWDSFCSCAVIKKYSVFCNGIEFAEISLRDTGEPQLQLNWWHPFLTKESRDDTGAFGRILEDIMYYFAGEDIYDSPPDDYFQNEFASSDSVTLTKMVPMSSLKWPLITPATVVPQWETIMSLKEGMGTLTEPVGLEMCSVLSQIIFGIGEAILHELSNLRYLGPLREIPNRIYASLLNPGQGRWANGLGAWDALLRSTPIEQDGSSLVERCSNYLNDTLGLQYTLRREDRIQLPAESNLFARLRLLATQFEESEGDDVRRILSEIEGLERITVVQIHDEKNDIDVDPMDIGVGVSQTLPVVVGAVEPNCTIFAVEQPELHIHPAVQSNLGDVFIKEALRENASPRLFLLETHSEHLILRILRRIRETSEGTLPDDFPPVLPGHVQVLYVEPSESGSKITELPVTEDGDFGRPWPNGFFTEREEDLF